MKIKSYPFFYGGKKQDWGKAVVVGGFVFLSGVSGREFETGEVKELDIKIQTRTVWIKVASILEEIGASLDRIVKIVIYLRNSKDYDDYRSVTREFLQKKCPELLENPPAMTLVEAGLYLEEMLVELDVTAVVEE